jgi:hypothetical protein
MKMIIENYEKEIERMKAKNALSPHEDIPKV